MVNDELTLERISFIGECLVVNRGQIMLTSGQIRAARAILRWSLSDLEDASGVSVSTIRRIEAAAAIPRTSTDVMQRLLEAFQQEGLGFFASIGENGPGVIDNRPVSKLPPE